MNWFGFTRLIQMIYSKSKRLPDLDWIQKQGLLAVKLGQVHALRIDFLDKEKCIHLSKLYRQNVSLPEEDVNTLINLYGGDSFRQHFRHIDPISIASASVGQVHRGQLKSGEEVVVKLVKKDVRNQFLKDVDSVKSLFRFITFFYPKIRNVGNPVGILDDIKAYTLSELDLTNEVTGQKTLRAIFDENKDQFDLSRLSFAAIYPELSNSNLMVSSYLPGKTFDELLDDKQLPYEKLLHLFQVHGFYLFITGTFHGDIHPGNLIYYNGQIYYIDTGYIGHVGEKIRTGLFNFFKALSHFDYPLCAQYLNEMSEKPIDGPAYKRFHNKFLNLYKDFTNSTVAEISLTKKMMQTIKLGVLSGMDFEKGIFAIIRSLMYLDGMVLRCNPKAVLLKDMRRYIEDFDKQLNL